MLKNTLNIILDVYSFLLLVRIIFSFATINTTNIRPNKFLLVVKQLTDITLKPVQRIIGPVQVGNMYLDFAPLIVLLIINIIQRYI